MTDFPRSLFEFQQRFGDEAACAQYLAAAEEEERAAEARRKAEEEERAAEARRKAEEEERAAKARCGPEEQMRGALARNMEDVRAAWAWLVAEAQRRTVGEKLTTVRHKRLLYSFLAIFVFVAVGITIYKE
jgi:hypothetical protein